MDVASDTNHIVYAWEEKGNHIRVMDSEGEIVSSFEFKSGSFLSPNKIQSLVITADSAKMFIGCSGGNIFSYSRDGDLIFEKKIRSSQGRNTIVTASGKGDRLAAVYGNQIRIWNTIEDVGWEIGYNLRLNDVRMAFDGNLIACMGVESQGAQSISDMLAGPSWQYVNGIHKYSENDEWHRLTINLLPGPGFGLEKQPLSVTNNLIAELVHPINVDTKDALGTLAIYLFRLTEEMQIEVLRDYRSQDIRGLYGLQLTQNEKNIFYTTNSDKDSVYCLSVENHSLCQIPVDDVVKKFIVDPEGEHIVVLTEDMDLVHLEVNLEN